MKIKKLSLVFRLAILTAILPTYLIRFSILNIPTTLLELLIYGLVISIFFDRQLLKSFYQKIIERRFWLIPALLMLIGGLIGVIVSSDKIVSLGIFKGFIFDPILVFIMMLVGIEKKEDFNLIFKGLIFGSLVIAIWTIIEWLKLNELRALGPYSLNSGSSPNYVAFALAPIVPFVHYQIKNLKSNSWRIGYLIIIGLMITAIFTTGSRAGLGAVIIGFLVTVAISNSLFWKNIWLPRILVGVLLMGLFFSWLVVKPNFVTPSSESARIVSSNNVRFQIWEATGELIRSQPVIGLGLGNFQKSFDLLTKDRINFSAYITPWARTPHNLLIGLWTDLGLLGLIAGFWVIILVTKTLFIYLKDDRKRLLSATLIGSWLIILIQGMVDMPIWKNDLMIIYWLMIALVAQLSVNKD